MDDTDICRVCRCEGSVDRPLFHPCICTGSIKYIHQECLVEWLRYSKKEFCKLCKYRFSFTPIYSPDMPKRLPLNVVLSGLAGTVGRAVKFWLHYTLVAVIWLGVVPLTACRIYRTLFTGSVSTIFSTENLAPDILQGCALVALTFLACIGLVCLLDHILHGGAPAWLELDEGAMGAGEPPRGQQLVAARDNEGPQPDLMQNVPEEPAAPEIVDPAAEVPGPRRVLLGLEHVFWAVSLNTLFILIFAFCPYHIGNFALAGFKMKHVTNGMIHFEGLSITMVGYCMIGFSLVILHAASSFFKFKRSARVLGLCYVVVKVAFIFTAEILAFPVICGWWLDVCSLSLFDASLKDRLISFQTAPWATIFMHWLVGMVYVFWFAALVYVFRMVLRPGVLWFSGSSEISNLNFNPIQEMIDLSPVRHVRRFCASLMMFGTSILVMFYCPSRIIRSSLPSFLPYTTAQSFESNVELNLLLELLLLLVILTSVIICIGRTMKKWCDLASWALGIRSYMFGDVALDARNNQPEENQIQVLHAWSPPVVDQAQPYNKPAYFSARICGLLGLMVVSLLLISLVMMVVPVWIGRQLFSLAVVEGVWDLWTILTGQCVCLLLARGCLQLARTWLSQGWAALATIAGKAAVALVLLMGIIPLMFGILLEMVVLTPLRVPLNLLQDWAFGAICTIITVNVTFMGPDWWLKIAIEQLYQDGIRNINLHRLIPNLVVPCVTRLGLALSLPYIVSHGLAPLIVSHFDTLVLIQRRIYPLTALFGSLLMLFIKQFVKLLEHIRDDRYLVERRLVNYDHQPHQN